MGAHRRTAHSDPTRHSLPGFPFRVRAVYGSCSPLRSRRPPRGFPSHRMEESRTRPYDACNRWAERERFHCRGENRSHPLPRDAVNPPRAVAKRVPNELNNARGSSRPTRQPRTYPPHTPACPPHHHTLLRRRNGGSICHSSCRWRIRATHSDRPRRTERHR